MSADKRVKDSERILKYRKAWRNGDSDHDEADALWEIALQLALMNERAEPQDTGPRADAGALFP
jgi:hypothetical protein